MLERSIFFENAMESAESLVPPVVQSSSQLTLSSRSNIVNLTACSRRKSPMKSIYVGQVFPTSLDEEQFVNFADSIFEYLDNHENISALAPAFGTGGNLGYLYISAVVNGHREDDAISLVQTAVQNSLTPYGIHVGTPRQILHGIAQ